MIKLHIATQEIKTIPNCELIYLKVVPRADSRLT